VCLPLYQISRNSHYITNFTTIRLRKRSDKATRFSTVWLSARRYSRNSRTFGNFVKNAYTELCENPTKISVADTGSQREGRTGSAHKATYCTLWRSNRKGGKNQTTNCRGQSERCHHYLHLHLLTEALFHTVWSIF